MAITDQDIERLRDSLPSGHYAYQWTIDALTPSPSHPHRQANARCECERIIKARAAKPAPVTEETLSDDDINDVRDNIAREPGTTRIVDITLALCCDAVASGSPAPEARARIADAINARAKGGR